MNFIHEFQKIIFPSRCLSCGKLFEGLCAQCKLDWTHHQYRSNIGDVHVISSLLYNPVAKQILLAAKEDGIREADEIVINALDHSLGLILKGNLSHVTLVPIPSSEKSNRRRGRDFLDEMTSRLTKTHNLSMQPLIKHTKRISDQSTLSASGRLENVRGAFTITPRHRQPRNLILVDDLLTTGATLAEASRTLRGAGMHVSGAITAFLAQPLR